MSWTLRKKLAQRRSRAGRWCWARERGSWTSLLQLFPTGGATDIVFVTRFCIAVGTATAWCGGCCAMPDGHCLNILFSGGCPRQPWSSGLAPVSRFHSSIPVFHPSPSLIGRLASVDVKQQKLTHFFILLSLFLRSTDTLCQFLSFPVVRRRRLQFFSLFLW